MKNEEYMVLCDQDYHRPLTMYHSENPTSEAEADDEATKLMNSDPDVEYAEVWKKIYVYKRRVNKEIEVKYV